MEKSQIAMEHEGPCTPENVPVQNGGCEATSFTQNNVVSQQPAKKPTRQWAAWTRQEEENFFTALRQVGKNFEKITSRVQSKNKDQVRHYYYRLVRRMNKLLGPELCLDAKNSKDTNAAMLRWWSLLEKYSCKASKLHLKPRRYKLFIEALESQLLKDRKKSMRKRLTLGEYCSPMDPCTTSFQNRASGPENRGVKLVLVDSQNVQKLGPGRGSLKRNVSLGLNRSTTRVDSAAIKPPRQQRNSGFGSSATYKRWEKAAIAGVSLVADAAEHLERTATKKDNHDGQNASGQRKFNPTVEGPSYTSGSLQNFLFGNNLTSAKLKLQLFPIDDSTRKALEVDKHNPHLELTLSTRKKISSVVEHLSRKWANASVANGGLMLFPYGVQRDNLVGYQRWSQESVVTAADVYAMIGSPPVFRLRYGWFSNDELGLGTSQVPRASSFLPSVCNEDMDRSKGHIAESRSTSVPSVNERSECFEDHSMKESVPVCKDHSLPSSVHPSIEMSRPDIAASSKEFVKPLDPSASKLWNKKETNVLAPSREFEDVGEQSLCNSTALLTGEWADSLTNVSVGDLLAEVPQDANANFSPHRTEDFQSFQQTPFSCDSFDAAIAAHISRQQDKSMSQSCFSSHFSTIWNSEETCDAFSFQNCAPSKDLPRFSGSATFGACKKDYRTNSMRFVGDNEMKLPEGEGSKSIHVDADPMDECPSDEHIGEEDPGIPMDECPSDEHIFDYSDNNFHSLADISWPDSLGPLDLEIPSSKYHSQDLILSDSLGGLNHLIASSLDAFQNCSFFGSEKKEPASTLESWGSASFSDLKIGSEG